MATNDDDGLAKFSSFIDNLEAYYKTLKSGDPVRIATHSLNLHSDPSIDLLLNNNLRLGCEIEAILDSRLRSLPDDKIILLNIAKERAQDTRNQNSRALDYYYEQNKKLKKEISELEEMIKNAEGVDEKLTTLLENKEEENEESLLRRRYIHLGTLFKELRDEFNWYLGTHFPMEDGETLDFDSMLEVLTKKFLDDPNDPYVTMKDNVKEEWINFLICSQVIFRHPNDPFKFRIADFRIN